MFGIGFLNSVFLYALGAALLPVVIHILNRRRSRRVPFSTLRFIEELSKRRMRRINLRRALILLLRTLAVLFLVVAFARPAIKGVSAFFVPGGTPVYTVICLDVSYSMGVEMERGTALTLAKKIAGEVVEQSGGEDLLNVVVFSSRSEALFEGGIRNKELVKKAIEGAELTEEKTAVGKAIEEAAKLIRDSEVGTGEIYVVSDFRAGLDSTFAPDDLEDIRIVFLPVYKEAVDNVSIDKVLTPRKLIRPGEVIKVGVVVTNRARENVASFPLEISIEGKRVAEKRVTLSAASTATVTFAISLNRWGSYRCRAGKNRDRLSIDDRRYFLLEVSRSIPVTILRGKKGKEEHPLAAAYFYVGKALNPRGEGENEFTLKLLDESIFTVSDLPDRGVVVWAEPCCIEGRRMAALERYVRRGGALMIFLGAGESSFISDRDFLGLIGAKRVYLREKAEGVGLTSFQGGHPIFHLFNQEELELLSRAKIMSYVAAAGIPADSVLAYLSSGDPGIWERSLGKGRVLVVALAPDLLGGDLPLSPMFLPLVHTAVSYLASASLGALARENKVGEPLFLNAPMGARLTTGGLTVSNPMGELVRPAVFETPFGETKVVYDHPEASGFFALILDSLRLAEVAVNVDTEESDLNPAPLDRKGLGGIGVVDTEGDFLKNLAEDRQGREVYTLFLFFALVALVLESLLGRGA